MFKGWVLFQAKRKNTIKQYSYSLLEFTLLYTKLSRKLQKPNPCSLSFILIEHCLMTSHTCLKVQMARWKKVKSPRSLGRSVQLTMLHKHRTEPSHLFPDSPNLSSHQSFCYLFLSRNPKI